MSYRYLLSCLLALTLLGCQSIRDDRLATPPPPSPDPGAYQWTPDHLQIGVRWQPFGKPQNDAYEATRPVIAEDSSYAQFWVSWAAAEPQIQNLDYHAHQSGYLKSIEDAVDVCNREGLKVEFVFWHCPAWASISGKAGGWRARKHEYQAFVTRIARHFKGRVHAYQLAHENNLHGFTKDGDVDYLMDEIFIKGARAIRTVYDQTPAEPVIISTTGCSPCEACKPLDGLVGKGGAAAANLYDRLIANRRLMAGVDALNFNVTDHFDGYGNMDGTFIPSTWGNYDLIRKKLDTAGYRDKSIMAAESWIVWDDAGNATDVNGDGSKDERDAYDKAVTIIGQCLQRGLNTINLPWSDNSSAWAMGLTKRRDYNGRVKQLDPTAVVPANNGGADVVTRKVALRGADHNFTIHDAPGNKFTIEDYLNPADPNHLHYYVWKWYAQLAAGSDEVIRHALAGEYGNDVTVLGPGFTGSQRFRIAAYNRTRDRFTVLLYAAGANGKSWAKLAIPATVQNGDYYNNEHSKLDFRGEGFPDGTRYRARIVTKMISRDDGSDQQLVETTVNDLKVTDDTLAVRIPAVNKFTKVEFIREK